MLQYGWKIARKRCLDEGALGLLREIDVTLHDGLNFVSAYRKAAISYKRYDIWRKRLSDLGRLRMSELLARSL